jgi:hypothetical protein
MINEIDVEGSGVVQFEVSVVWGQCYDRHCLHT